MNPMMTYLLYRILKISKMNLFTCKSLKLLGTLMPFFKFIGKCNKIVSVSVNRQTYKELDSELKHLQSNQSSIGKIGDINLSFLMNKLYPEKDVKDKDVVWTMESLFNTLKSSKTN